MRLVRKDLKGLACSEQAYPGGYLVDVSVRDVDRFGRWLLGWGRRARLLGPPEMQRKLRSWMDAQLELTR